MYAPVCVCVYLIIYFTFHYFSNGFDKSRLHVNSHVNMVHIGMGMEGEAAMRTCFYI